MEGHSTVIHHVHRDDYDAGDQPHQVLEIQTLSFDRILAGVHRRLAVHETAPIPHESAQFDLPLRELDNLPTSLQIYIADHIYLLDIPAATSEHIAGEIASYILQITGENRDTNFHVVASVYKIRLRYERRWPIDGGTGGEAPANVERFRMEKLEENGDEDLGICCICLDEIDCKKSHVVKIPCGHVYHKSCVSTWLNYSNSCPLCRCLLPLKEGSR